jgi:putative aldouronate transport system permease protein
MDRKSKIKEPFVDRVFIGCIYFLLSIVLVVVCYPLIFIVSSSLSSPTAVSQGKVWLFPVEPTLAGYYAVFKNSDIMIGYGNSAFYAIAGTLIGVTLTVMLAYPMSRKTFFGKNAFMMVLVFTLLFSGGLIPTYMLMRSLHLLDTRWVMILPGAVAVFQVIIARTFFQSTIPDELAEAAEIDGCSDGRFITSIVLPLSKPILAVMSLMYAVGFWNSYFDALIYLKDPNLYPLQLVLRSIIVLNTQDLSMMNDASKFAERQGLAELLKYSLIVVASLPVLIIYPFVQKHFVKGVLIGSLKA